MCGKNSSFTSDLTFTSSNEKITLIFRRKSSGIKAQASFNMTFIAFYEGKWDNKYDIIGNGRRYMFLVPMFLRICRFIDSFWVPVNKYFGKQSRPK